MDIMRLSDQYTVEVLSDRDIPAVLKLSESNPQYFHYFPPAASTESIKADMQELPDGISREDKYYLGFREKSEKNISNLSPRLVAVMDLILNYPDDKTALIGFFMVDASLQGKGIGSSIVDEICSCLKSQFDFIRLGYVQGNLQAENFWLKNEFKPTGTIKKIAGIDVVVAQRRIGSSQE